jgi:DNA-binding GntR family transcriptional regulator
MNSAVKTKKHLSDALFTEVLNRIVSGQYPPGQMISEKELCQEFQVSRSPFREAIRKLEEMRMVEVIPRFGTFVSKIDLEEVTAAYEVRLYMEVAAAGLAAERRTPKQLRAFKELTSEAAGYGDGMEWATKRYLDQRFHEIIWEASHNQIMVESLRNLKMICMRLNTARLSDSFSEEEILDLLNRFYGIMRDRDRAGMESIMRDHMLSAVEYVKETVFSKFNRFFQEQ